MWGIYLKGLHNFLSLFNSKCTCGFLTSGEVNVGIDLQRKEQKEMMQEAGRQIYFNLGVNYVVVILYFYYFILLYWILLAK